VRAHYEQLYVERRHLCEWEIERWVIDDHTVVTEGWFDQIFPGHVLVSRGLDIDDPDGVTSVLRLYAWLQWYQTTAVGIASPFFGAITAQDAATYIVDQSKADVKLDNISSIPVRITGGYLSRRDGSTIIAAGSNSIQMDPGRAYVAGLSNPIVLQPGERLITALDGGYLARS
jgi:hypothetical protein